MLVLCKKMIQYSFKEKLLLMASFVFMGIIRFVIIVMPFKYVSKFIGEKMADSPYTADKRTYRRAWKIGWAVDLMSRHTPWESKCLVQAISALVLLKIFKVHYTLYLGLNKGNDNDLIAHAWLRCGELIITGDSPNNHFQVVAQFAYIPSD